MWPARWDCKDDTKRARAPKLRRAGAEDEERWWVCRQCSAPITPSSARTDVDGTHVHVRENPLGRVFRFGCFRTAPGVRTVGEPSAEATWFAGYLWAIAVCDGCRAHLGWHFQGREPDFYGLILDHLAEQELPRA